MQYYSHLILIGAVFALCGCEGTTEALGLGRNVPDEFAVVDRPPLSLPPEFDLRPPLPGAPRPQEISMPRKAEETLFGAGSVGEEGSEGEKALLEQAGADRANPEIRVLIDKETSQKIVGSRHLVDEILWWRKNDDATTVDAQAEAERIREAKEKGEPVSSGATPVIEKNKSGWLGP